MLVFNRFLVKVSLLILFTLAKVMSIHRHFISLMIGISHAIHIYLFLKEVINRIDSVINEEQCDHITRSLLIFRHS